MLVACLRECKYTTEVSFVLLHGYSYQTLIDGSNVYRKLYDLVKSVNVRCVL